LEFVAAAGCRLTFGLLSAGFLLAACTDVAKLPPGPDAPPAHQTAYLIQPGDQLDVKFDKNPELNEQPVVQPDGRISMLYAHNLQVGGRSFEEVQKEMTTAYSTQLREPGISVNLKNPNTWHVYIGGQVLKPTEFTNTGPLPSLQAAIAYAGGILDSGDKSKIVLTRRTPDGTRVGYLVNFGATARGYKPGDNIHLAPYDVLYVPKTGVADVWTGYNQWFQKFLPPNFGLGYALARRNN
jgi:polysaccharide export outer membrane protein